MAFSNDEVRGFIKASVGAEMRWTKELLSYINENMNATYEDKIELLKLSAHCLYNAIMNDTTKDHFMLIEESDMSLLDNMNDIIAEMSMNGEADPSLDFIPRYGEMEGEWES